MSLAFRLFLTGTLFLGIAVVLDGFPRRTRTYAAARPLVIGSISIMALAVFLAIWGLA